MTRTALSWRGSYDPSLDTLFCGHPWGFFSACCVALWNIDDLQRAGHPAPQRIDFSGALESFRDEAQRVEKTDLYPLFFKPDLSVPVAAVGRVPRVNQHGVYRLLPYRRLAPAMQRYFTPSAAAIALREQLRLRYRYDPATTIAVVYRGTDKSQEIRIAPPEHYLALTRHLLIRNPGFRVWIQTDERAVRQLFCHAFGERCFFLDEMPTSTNGAVVHHQSDQTLRMARSDFGVLLVAVNSLLSEAAVVVNHTGNMALWLMLMRGNGRGVWQFDDEGRAIDPAWPFCWWGALRRFNIKATRKIDKVLLRGAIRRLMSR